MPELPEMENYRQQLEQNLKGHVVTDVEVNREKSINVSLDTFMNKVQNQKVVRIERKAKHLLFHLSNGNVLLLHLMLGGWMFYGDEKDKPDRTIQIRLSFRNKHLYFIGLRLGYLHLFSQKEVDQKLSDLGPEPLSLRFTLPVFNKLIESRRGRLKTKLIDQSFISGIGNCYSDEICYHAQILPARNVNDLDQNEINQLYHSIQQVLKQALLQGGYIEIPLYKGDSKTGGYQTMVYDREGERCKRCGSKIIKDTVSSRKTFFCRGCQR